MTRQTVLFVLPAILAFALTPVVRAFARRIGAVDRPGYRRLHAGEVPRLGGVAAALAAAIGLVALATYYSMTTGRPIAVERWSHVLVGGALVFAVGVWDDVRPLRPSVKLIGMVAAALSAVALGVRIDAITVGGETIRFGVLAVPITVLWIVGITNAFNLVDGLDGLAAGLATIAAAASVAILFLRGDADAALPLLVLLGATVGFLPYNFNPATIFLGDSGALLFGYVLAVTAVEGKQKGVTVIALAVPLLLFAIPITDTLLALGRRLIRGQRQPPGAPVSARLRGVLHVFEADQEHIHHHLLGRGLSQRRVVLLLYAFAIACSAVAVLLVWAT